MKNRLRVLRAERGWSQADLARRLNVSRQTVNAIENERYDPSLPLAFAIGRVFETTVEGVFDPGILHDEAETARAAKSESHTPGSEV